MRAHALPSAFGLLGLAVAPTTFAQAPPVPAAPTIAATPATEGSGLGELALRPTILGEVDYRTYPSEAEGASGFALARFRPGVVMTPSPWFRAVGTLELASTVEGSPILDAYMTFRAAEWAEIDVGYSKTPMFASFRYEPVQTLPFPDRAPVVTSFRVRRDVGVDVHLAPRRVPIEGWVRVGNGTGSALGNDNALPAAYGLLNLVLGRAWAGAAPEQRRFGLRLGASVFVESTRDRNGITGETPFGFVYFRPIVVSGLRAIGEAHAVAYAGPLRVTVEGAVAHESRSRDDDGNPSTPRLELSAVQSYGLTAEVAWVVRGRPRDVGVVPQSSFRDDGRWAGGAIEISGRYDGMWLGHGAADVRSGGSQGGALAVRWCPADFLAAALAGYVTLYDVAAIEDPDRSWSWGVLARGSFFWGLPGHRPNVYRPGTPEASQVPR